MREVLEEQDLKTELDQLKGTMEKVILMANSKMCSIYNFAGIINVDVCAFGKYFFK